ncbi:MAG: hypothetical protein GWO20_18620 [Candidatus Korarchaeota archaeon]|nr:hypothetical protein [Candidatus Korarchaeota archaeon]
MQTQKTVEYDMKMLLQTVLDTMKSLRRADNVAYPKENKERWLQRQNLT